MNKREHMDSARLLTELEQVEMPNDPQYKRLAYALAKIVNLESLLIRQKRHSEIYERRLARAHEKLEMTPDEIEVLQFNQTKRRARWDLPFNKNNIMALRSKAADLGHKAREAGSYQDAIWYYGNYNAFQACAFGSDYVKQLKDPGNAFSMWGTIHDMDDEMLKTYDQITRRSFFLGLIAAALLVAVLHVCGVRL